MEKSTNPKLAEKMKEAVDSLTKAIEDDPSDFEAYFNRGLCYAYGRKYKEALEDFEHAIKICPFETDSYHNIEVTREKLKGLQYYYEGTINSEKMLFEELNTLVENLRKENDA